MKYLRESQIYLPHAFAAMRNHFDSQRDFDEYFSNIATDEQKNAFLRVASFYRFLAKDGDWHVEIDGSDPVISYITGTLKLVSIFSLIESISGAKYLDLYQWISKSGEIFPIKDQQALDALHQRYIESYGSIRRCVAFFQALPTNRQIALREAVIIDRKPSDSIEKVARYLYELRSSYVHDGKFAVELIPGSVFSSKGKKVIETKINIQHFLELFEEGLLLWFRPTV
jgi:hypothetical protein